VWFAKMFLAMVVLAAVCFFAILNADQKVNLTVAPGREYLDVPLVVALFAAFVLGAVIIFILSLFRDVRTRSGVSKLRRQNARLSEELTALRNLPLDEPEAGAEGEKTGELHEG
jgi:uncharacterized integral membrane protein